MSSITFDTLSSARWLRGKGVPQEQAEAFADELRIASETERDISYLASKADLLEVKAELIKYMFTGFIALAGFQAAILGVAITFFSKIH